MMLLLSICSPLLPIIAGWYKKFTCLWYYALASFLTDTTAYLFKRVLHINHYWFVNLFLLTEFILISCFYRSSVLKSKILFSSVLIAGIVLFCVHTSLATHWFKFNYVASSVFYFYYIVLAIAGFYRMLQEKKMIFLEQSTFFWANVAILVYASGNFFVFLFRNNVQAADPAMMMLLWTTVFLSLNILKNILLAIALRKKE